MRRFVIFSTAGDLHALGVQVALRRRGIDCHTVPTDQLTTRRFTWGDDCGASWYSTEGHPVNLAEADGAWVRRIHQRQKHKLDDRDADDLVVRDGRACLVGALYTSFGGIAFNDPQADQRADNKLFQLHTAVRVGLRVPRTLVSHDPPAIRSFVSRVGRVVAKPVKGTPRVTPFVREVDAEVLRNDAALAACPTIYQEFIPGARHLRVHLFGSSKPTMEITHERLVDWRADLNVPASEYELDDSTSRKLDALLDALHLRMGIADFKLTEAGEPVFLEVNPQGQFLFAQALMGVDLADRLARYFADSISGEP